MPWVIGLSSLFIVELAIAVLVVIIEVIKHNAIKLLFILSAINVLYFNRPLITLDHSKFILISDKTRFV